MKKMKAISLFASAGIGELRLPSSIDVVAANELISSRADCYRHFYPNTNMLCGDITDDSIKKQIIEIANKKK